MATSDKAPDLSGEVDLDQYDLHDYKWLKDTEVDFWEDRFVHEVTPMTIVQDLDELV